MRYILFGGGDYYPLGGANDLSSCSDDIDELIILARKFRGDWWHIFDMKEGEIIADNGELI